MCKPFGKDSARIWKMIYDNCKIPVKDGIALKRRFGLLYDNFTKNNLKSLKSSGTEEEYSEEIQLLDEIKSLIENYKLNEESASDNAGKKIESDRDEAEKIRKTATETLNYETKSSKRKKSDLVEMMKSSEEKEHEAKLILMDIKKEKVSLLSKHLDIQERELSLREINDAHRREMEKKKMELEERKLIADLNEKSLLFQLLKSHSQNTAQ